MTRKREPAFFPLALKPWYFPRGRQRESFQAAEIRWKLRPMIRRCRLQKSVCCENVVAEGEVGINTVDRWIDEAEAKQENCDLNVVERGCSIRDRTNLSNGRRTRRSTADLTLEFSGDAAARHSDPGDRGHRRLSRPDVPVSKKEKTVKLIGEWKSEVKVRARPRIRIHPLTRRCDGLAYAHSRGWILKRGDIVDAPTRVCNPCNPRADLPTLSGMSVNLAQNLLSSMVPKHEYLLYEIESTDTNSIGLVFRYYC